jgi:hypothetical protein
MQSDLIERNEQFEVNLLNEDGINKANQIRDSFDVLLNSLSSILGSYKGEREFSIVKTKLEEACFFAKKSMAINLSNQKIGD